MCGAPLVIPPLIEPSGHRPLKAVDLGFQSGVPGDLPTSPQPVFQTYFILNTGRDLGRGSAIGRRLGVDASIAPRLAPETISTRVSISIPLCNSGLNGISASRWVWNLAESVRLTSGRSGVCWKDEQNIVSMSTGR